MVEALTRFVFGAPSLPPKDAARRFAQRFETEYGSTHPRFLEESYKSAIDRAKADAKFLLVYLHSEEHEHTPTFCRTAICDERIVNSWNENFVVWAGSVTDADAFAACQHLGASQFPFVALLACVRNSITVVDRCEGLLDATTLLSRLR